MIVQPGHDRLLVVVTCCDREHQVHGFVSGDLEAVAVEGEEDGQCLPRKALVAVRERVVASDADDEHRSFSTSDG